MFGKVNPAPAVSKSIRVVFRSLPEPQKLFKTIKNRIFIVIDTIFPQRSEGATLGRPKGRHLGGL